MFVSSGPKDGLRLPADFGLHGRHISCSSYSSNISLAQGIKLHNLAFLFIESDIETYRRVSVPTVTKEKENQAENTDQ